MKKKTGQLQVIMSLVIVFTMLLGCGALTYQKATWAKSEIYEQVKGKPQYFCSIIEEYHKWGETGRGDPQRPRDTKNGLNIIPAFYLAHEDWSNNPIVSSDVGFHSVLRNSKGEVIAEYQPFILFKKHDSKTIKMDIRVLVLGDEFVESCGRVYDEYDVINNLDYCYGYGKGEADVMGVSLEVDGTCDDTFVYLNKLTWYHRTGWNNETYGYIPEDIQIGKGSVDFEEWYDYENGNADFDMQSIRNYYWIGDNYNNNAKDNNKEAKEICEKDYELFCNSETYSSDLEGNLLTSELKLSRRIYSGIDSSDYYVFSCAYVFHPLKMAVEELAPVYAVAAGIALVLIIFVCVLLNFKLNGTKSDSDDEKKGESAEAEKTSEETTENDENNTENLLEQHKDYT